MQLFPVSHKILATITMGKNNETKIDGSRLDCRQ